MVTWKDIDGYDGAYSISPCGLVKSNDRQKPAKLGSHSFQRGKLIKSRIGTDGYPTVFLSKNGHAQGKRVHRLLADAFITKINGKNYVNHKDGNKRNNELSNLEWCTFSENIRHSFLIGKSKAKIGEDHHGVILNSEKVLEIRKKYTPFIYTLRALAKEYGVNKATISDIIQRRTWTHI